MAKTSANGRPKKLRQQRLPGMEPPSNKKLDGYARNFEDARDERMARSVNEKAAKDTLLAEMVSCKLTRYETPDGLIVSVTVDQDVKVKKSKEPKEQEVDAD